MTTRYFKATDGSITVFRASATKVYQSAKVERGSIDCIISFSGKPAGVTLGMPAVEITKAEYAALVALKAARFARAKAEWIEANPGQTPSFYRFAGSAPSDSWVSNGELGA